MLNSSTGLFFFKFNSMDGLDAMLENGLWFICNNPFILKKWNPGVNLLKEDVSNIPVWVKLYGVPVTAFSEDGLSVISTKLGTPLMRDSYTSDMCIKSWGMSSYARALIKIQADVELKDTIVVDECPKNIGSDVAKNLKKPSQAPRDDEGKPLENIDYSGDHDSKDEVESVDNEMASFLASKKVGYGTNSLLEQWKKTYENDDYDYGPDDDDLYAG
ncbi:reverse transcriptase domain-containing protein [Tanacetum coccineum]